MRGTLKLTLVVVVAMLIIGGIGLVGLSSQREATSGSTTNSAPNLNAVTEDDVALTITYTGKGFEPNTGTINVNESIRVRNRSVRILKFMSDPYPTENDEPELNIGELKPGESKTIYISQKGTWGYHNALDPSETGSLLVH